MAQIWGLTFMNCKDSPMPAVYLIIATILFLLAVAGYIGILFGEMRQESFWKSKIRDGKIAELEEIVNLENKVREANNKRMELEKQ